MQHCSLSTFYADSSFYFFLQATYSYSSSTFPPSPPSPSSPPLPPLCNKKFPFWIVCVSVHVWALVCVSIEIEIRFNRFEVNQVDSGSQFQCLRGRGSRKRGNSIELSRLKLINVWNIQEKLSFGWLWISLSDWLRQVYRKYLFQLTADEPPLTEAPRPTPGRLIHGRPSHGRLSHGRPGLGRPGPAGGWAGGWGNGRAVECNNRCKWCDTVKMKYCHLFFSFPFFLFFFWIDCIFLFMFFSIFSWCW